MAGFASRLRLRHGPCDQGVGRQPPAVAGRGARWQTVRGRCGPGRDVVPSAWWQAASKLGSHRAPALRGTHPISRRSFLVARPSTSTSRGGLNHADSRQRERSTRWKQVEADGPEAAHLCHAQLIPGTGDDGMIQQTHIRLQGQQLDIMRSTPGGGAERSRKADPSTRHRRRAGARYGFNYGRTPPAQQACPR